VNEGREVRGTDSKIRERRWVRTTGPSLVKAESVRLVLSSAIGRRVAQGAGGTGMDAQLGVARQPGVRCSLYARAGTGAGRGSHAQVSVASYGYDR
jgi:hypothetical protein